MIEPNPLASPIVQVSDLSLMYPAHGGSRAFNAVEGVSFELGTEQVLGILGESGSGKSSLTRFLAARARVPSDRGARVRLSGGDARVFDVSMRRIGRKTTSRLTARIGYLAQNAGSTLSPELTVGDILMQPIVERQRDFELAESGQKIAEMMDLVDLPLTTLSRYPYELSKGQRQRVAVIHSLMLEPTLLIADEPTLGIDANNRPKIVELLKWHRDRTQASMVVITHDIGMLEAIVQQVLIMQQGRLVGSGHINDVFRQADHGYVNQLANALRTTAYDEIAES